MLGFATLGQLAFAEFPQNIVTIQLQKRDTHDWLPKYRHPSVYTKEYYDSLQLKAPVEFYENPIEAPLVPAPNLHIPLTRLIAARPVPTLRQPPPYRPVPTLTVNPPPFKMATPEEMASDDEMIIRMLLED